MSTSFTLIPTQHAEHLAKLMAYSSQCAVVYLQANADEARIFPDGEVYVEVPDMPRGQRIVILHSGAPDPNTGIVELELLLQTLSRLGHQHLEVFFSYMPYGMQDNPKSTHAAHSAEDLVRKLVQYHGVKRIYVLDAHFATQPWVKKYPLRFISAFPLLEKAVRVAYPDVVFLAPDTGSQQRLGISGAKKIRTNSFEVEIVTEANFRERVKGKVIAVVDDLVETGGTMTAFAATCKAHGATTVVAAVTHGLLQEGIVRLQKSYSKLYLTNSIDRPAATIDVSTLILESLSSSMDA
ncbi:MAG: ribose-phosphate diphosphokinase [bacterium]